MIRVNIIKNEMIIKSVYKNVQSDTLMAWAQENEKNPGYCIFNENGELIEIIDKDNVFELLIRASLNRLDLDGVEVAYSYKEEYFAELKKLGFKENGRRMEVVIKDFFKPCCHH